MRKGGGWGEEKGGDDLQDSTITQNMHKGTNYFICAWIISKISGNLERAKQVWVRELNSL